MKKKSIRVRYKKHQLRIPYLELVGKKDGPHMFISAGMHGNEINGIAIVREFIQWAKEANLHKKLSGKLTILPVMNVSGFRENIRYVAEDGKDLNRQFGIEKPKSISQQIAYDLTHKILKKCDFGVDFHDAGKGSILIPHARIHKNDALKCVSCSRDFARIFGTKIVLERDGNSHMLAVALNAKYKRPVITVEIGGNKQIFHKYHDVALRGVRNILIAMRMIKGKMKMPRKQYVLHGRFGVSIKQAAQVTFNKKLGSRVHMGEEIGELYYPTTVKTEPIISPMCGLLFSTWGKNIAAKGQKIFSVLETKRCHTRRTTTKHFEEMGKFGLEQMSL